MESKKKISQQGKPISRKEWEDFTRNVYSSQNKIQNQVRALTNSIMGDNLGNKGLVPKVEGHVVDIDNLNRNCVAFEHELKNLVQQKTHIEDLDIRTSNLERWRAWILGAVAMASATGAGVGVVIGWLITLNGG